MRPAPAPLGAERLTLSTDGVRLKGLHFAPAGPVRDAPVVLCFPGNAWNATEGALMIRRMLPHAHVVAFHYRGYAPSSGRPSATSLSRDAERIFDHVSQRFPGKPVVAVGFSIGSGIAAHLASRRNLAGAVLVTPFDSFRRVAGETMPWVPVRWLLTHRLEPAADLAGSDVPAALIVAGNDRVISPERGLALAQAVAHLASYEVLAGAGHDDIYDRPEFPGMLRSAIEAVLRVEPA